MLGIATCLQHASTLTVWAQTSTACTQTAELRLPMPKRPQIQWHRLLMRGCEGVHAHAVRACVCVPAGACGHAGVYLLA